MLENLFGSINKERVLIYLYVNGEGYARAIAQFYGTNLRNIQVQLDNLELGGVLVSRQEGRTRLYEFNPRWPFRKELEALLGRMLEFLPPDERERLVAGRRRPRRRGKPS